MNKLFWVISGLLCLMPAYAASFDCQNAQLTDIEMQICADQYVSAQDEKLASLYRKLQAGATASQREALKADQQQWLHDVRNTCSFPSCLYDVYQFRIAKLEELNLDGWQTWVSEKEAFAELVRRSHTPENELTEMYRENTNSQLAGNFRSWGLFIAVDLKMGKMLEQKLVGLPLTCRSMLQDNQANWQASRDPQCYKEAEEESGGGGSMRMMQFYLCQKYATEERIAYLRSLKSCEAVRKSE